MSHCGVSNGTLCLFKYMLTILILILCNLTFFYRYLGQKAHYAMNYLAPFWNAVDLRYNLLEYPQVKLNIAGIILAQVNSVTLLFTNLFCYFLLQSSVYKYIEFIQIQIIQTRYPRNYWS